MTVDINIDGNETDIRFISIGNKFTFNITF